MSGAPVSQIKQRVGLIRHAISLCASLCDALGKIETSRFKRPSSYMNDEVAIALDELFHLEDALNRQMQELAERRNGALVSISRLPDDILRHIFEINCVPPTDREGIMWSINPIRLSHVCRRWRYLAIDTANIWACASFYPRRVFVDPNAPPSLQIRSLAGEPVLDDKYSVFLSRSRACLLTVDLPIGHSVDPDSPGWLSMVTEFLGRCSGRIKYLEAKVSPDTEELLIQFLSSSQGVLQKLVLSNVGDDLSIPATTMKDVLAAGMPQLRDITLIQIPLPSHYESRFIGLASCRKLDLSATDDSHFSSDKLRMLLTCCPELRQLSLDIHASIVDVTSLGDRICAENLESFDICSSHSIVGAFSVFKAPQLKRLALTFDADDVPSEHVLKEEFLQYVRAVQEFLRTSSPPLQIFRSSELPAAHVISLLRIIPPVKQLELDSLYDETGRSRQLMRDMSAYPLTKDGPICPSLESLKVDIRADCDLLDALWSFCRARANGGVRTMPIRRILIAKFPRSYEDHKCHEMYSKLAAEVGELIIGEWKFDRTIQDWVHLDGMDS